jgi:hypothetical protein
VSVTSQDLLARAEERTGLVRNQLLLMVAKSAAVRHIAQGPYSEHFVLKGGTLLTHVYSSPRQSIQDADYLHRQAETVSAPNWSRRCSATRKASPSSRRSPIRPAESSFAAPSSSRSMTS